MGNSVFVLGAGGFIGHALCADFAARGWQVFAGTRQPVNFSHPEIRNAVAAFNGIEDFVPWVEQCSVIVHAASHTTPSSSAAPQCRQQRGAKDEALRPASAASCRAC